MAIDTRNKRSSAINPQCPWRGQWPAPDSTIDQADRQHALWSYSGILAGVVTVTANLWFTLGNQRTEYTLPRAPDITSDDNATEFTLEQS